MAYPSLRRLDSRPAPSIRPAVPAPAPAPPPSPDKSEDKSMSKIDLTGFERRRAAHPARKTSRSAAHQGRGTGKPPGLRSHAGGRQKVGLSPKELLRRFGQDAPVRRRRQGSARPPPTATRPTPKPGPAAAASRAGCIEWLEAGKSIEDLQAYRYAAAGGNYVFTWNIRLPPGQKAGRIVVVSLACRRVKIALPGRVLDAPLSSRRPDGRAEHPPDSQDPDRQPRGNRGEGGAWLPRPRYPQRRGLLSKPTAPAWRCSWPTRLIRSARRLPARVICAARRSSSWRSRSPPTPSIPATASFPKTPTSPGSAKSAG